MTNQLKIASDNVEQTIDIAKRIGARLKGGEVVEIISDLGGGKTTFTKGLSAGAGSVDKVRSPSFTIENVYVAKTLTIYHLDFYRLNDSGIMANELTEKLSDKSAVVVIEWADIIENILPKNRLVIKIKVTGDQSRQFDISYPDQLSYLVKGLD